MSESCNWDFCGLLNTACFVFVFLVDHNKYYYYYSKYPEEGEVVKKKCCKDTLVWTGSKFEGGGVPYC